MRDFVRYGDAPMWSELAAAMPRHRRQLVSVDANRHRERCLIDPCVCVDCRTCECVRSETGEKSVVVRSPSQAICALIPSESGDYKGLQA